MEQNDLWTEVDREIRHLDVNDLDSLPSKWRHLMTGPEK